MLKNCLFVKMKMLYNLTTCITMLIFSLLFTPIHNSDIATVAHSDSNNACIESDLVDNSQKVLGILDPNIIFIDPISNNLSIGIKTQNSLLLQATPKNSNINNSCCLSTNSHYSNTENNINEYKHSHHYYLYSLRRIRI